MGLIMEFYAGDKDQLAKAFSNFEFDSLNSIHKGKADFSLHITPIDLEILFEELASFNNLPILPIEAILSGPISGDGEEMGVFSR